MQKRIRKIANFFAFNILFFALYLNFIGKDPAAVSEEVKPQATAFGAMNIQPHAEKAGTPDMAHIK